jgi:hypothetical protein
MPKHNLTEIDDCPVCGRPCKLEITYEESTGFECDMGIEVAYATCKTCKTRWRKREDPTDLGKRTYEKWAYRLPKESIGRWVKIVERHLPVGSL